MLHAVHKDRLSMLTGTWQSLMSTGDHWIVMSSYVGAAAVLSWTILRHIRFNGMFSWCNSLAVLHTWFRANKHKKHALMFTQCQNDSINANLQRTKPHVNIRSLNFNSRVSAIWSLYGLTERIVFSAALSAYLHLTVASSASQTGMISSTYLGQLHTSYGIVLLKKWIHVWICSICALPNFLT